MPITTTAEYKAYARITVTTYDTEIGVLVGVVQDAAERFCDRLFTSATYTEKFSGRGSPKLILRNTPIASVTSLVMTDGEGSTDYTFASTEFKYDDASGVLELTPSYAGRFAGDGAWSEGFDSGMTWGVSPAFGDQFRNVTCVYVGGYSTAPDSLKYAMWKMIDTAMGGKRRDGTVASESLGQYSVQFGNQNLQHAGDSAMFASTWGMAATSALLSYRRPSVA